jgi:outer membrane beta-barrel protein
MKKSRLGISITLAVIILAAWAPVSPAACPEPPETEGAGRKGLAKRNFEKSLRHEVNLFGGVYASEIMGTASLTGVSYTFHISEDFALETGFSYAWLSSAIARPVERFAGYTFLESHSAFVYSGSLLWHPFHGKFMFFRSAVPHFDFYFKAGVGITDSLTSKGLTYSAGAGMKIFVSSWMSLRVEICDNIYVQEVLSTQSLTNNLSVTLGVGIWIPFSKS